MKPLEILSIVSSATEAPYDKPINVEVSVFHLNPLPTVVVYYAPLVNASTPGGWRFSAAVHRSIYLQGRGQVSLYSAQVPNPSYSEIFPYGTTIVFHVEVSDQRGNTALSAKSQERWKPGAEGKFTLKLIDPYPPKFNASLMRLSPFTVTEQDKVTITISVTDDVEKGGSGVARVIIRYSVDLAKWNELEAREVEKGLYLVEVPPYKRGSTIYFHFEAVDKVGNKARTSNFWYSVSERGATQTGSAETLTAAVIVPPFLAVIVAATIFRSRLPPYLKENRAKLYVYATTFLVVGLMTGQLIQTGRTWWAFFTWLILISTLASLEEPNRRIIKEFVMEPTFNLSRNVAKFFLRLADENPPAIFLIVAYTIGVVSGAILAALFLAKIVSLDSALQTANMISTYLFALLVAAVTGQLLWRRQRALTKTKSK